MIDVKTWAAVIGGLSAVIGLILGAMKLYTTLGLPIVVTEEGVDRKLAPITSTIQGMRSDINDNSLHSSLQRRSQIDNSIAQWKLDLQRSTDEQSRKLEQERIDELVEQRAVVEKRIQSLQRDMYGAH